MQLNWDDVMNLDNATLSALEIGDCPIPDNFTTTKFDFITIGCEILFYFDKSCRFRCRNSPADVESNKSNTE
jgi:hypothetical protein